MTMAALAGVGIEFPRAQADNPIAVVRPSIVLDHPRVIDTATLQAGDSTVTLDGIQGIAGPPATSLVNFLSSTDGRLTCQPQASERVVCLTSDGTDVAQVALLNGAATTTPDAPAAYREQEAQAQAARRGIWDNLPPPPETVTHPIVRDTATLSAEGKIYALDGLIGLPAPYTSQLQDMIVSHGDSVTCMPQTNPGHYICVLPDGTDVGRAALANGLARVAPDAPQAYRVQQADALNARAGYWRTALEPMIAAAQPPPGLSTPPEPSTLLAGDVRTDGITEADGIPVALIAGETAFLLYGAGYIGWGYYDHFHHWHRVPERLRTQLEHFHPDGSGPRGYGPFHDPAGPLSWEVAVRPPILPNVIHPGTPDVFPNTAGPRSVETVPVFRPAAVIGHYEEAERQVRLAVMRQRPAAAPGSPRPVAAFPRPIHAGSAGSHR